MIVIDTSAMIAILEKAPGHELLAAAIVLEDKCIVSALTVYETSVVMLRKLGPDGMDDVRQLLDSFEVEIVPFTATDSLIATQAYQHYGRHADDQPALTICDCAAYGLAKARSALLLYAGTEFARTDVAAAI